MEPDKKFTLSIVVPVYNEEKYIAQVFEKLLAVKFQDGVRIQIVAVDDCSKDKTWEQLQLWEKKGVLVARHAVNGGKGAALHTGFTMTTGDAVTIQDADFEYDPNDLPNVLQPILDGRADIVFGAREDFLGNVPFAQKFHWHYLVNKFLTVFCNLFSGLRLNDMECCYKMFRNGILQKVTLYENRFGFEPEVTLKTARFHLPTAEVPVRYAARTWAEGKKINWKDGVSALRCILKYGLLRK